ncbi:MAG TPA: type II toxin-antitoxin system RelE/ParE family toxin [Candidatus Elarobacter sp.]|nr:type II toxin-antitoxin system RelE/ParE family toxin [Candidatus Elarobacter sp.]
MKPRGTVGPALEKPIHWIGTSREDLSAFPPRVKSILGYALRMAQRNERHDDAKPMHGAFSGLMEIVAHDERRRTFRVVYLARFESSVYVLHAFCKKSKHGIATPKRELDLVARRWKTAKRHHEESHGEAGL